MIAGAPAAILAQEMILQVAEQQDGRHLGTSWISHNKSWMDMRK